MFLLTFGRPRQAAIPHYLRYLTTCDTSLLTTHYYLLLQGNFIWAGDQFGNHTLNSSQALSCAGTSSNQGGISFPEAPYAYDGILALAHAIHYVVEINEQRHLDGKTLMQSLLDKVNFPGVTGEVNFYNAKGVPNLHRNGDRLSGVRLNILNYADNYEGLVAAGGWGPCATGNKGVFQPLSGCSWLERWQPSGRALTFSTKDNSQPPNIAATKVTVVRLGILLPMFYKSSGDSKFAVARAVRHTGRAMLFSSYMAIQEINNHTDLIDDWLLPHTHLEFAYADSQCNSAAGLSGSLRLMRAFGGEGVSIILGAECSGATMQAARVAEASGVPVLSPAATTSQMSNGKTFPFFARSECPARLASRHHTTPHHTTALSRASFLALPPPPPSPLSRSSTNSNISGLQ